jgi:hypothetical protein
MVLRLVFRHLKLLHLLCLGLSLGLRLRMLHHLKLHHLVGVLELQVGLLHSLLPFYWAYNSDSMNLPLWLYRGL